MIAMKKKYLLVLPLAVAACSSGRKVASDGHAAIDDSAAIASGQKPITPWLPGKVYGDGCSTNANFFDNQGCFPAFSTGSFVTGSNLKLEMLPVEGIGSSAHSQRRSAVITGKFTDQNGRSRDLRLVLNAHGIDQGSSASDNHNSVLLQLKGILSMDPSKSPARPEVSTLMEIVKYKVCDMSVNNIHRIKVGYENGFKANSTLKDLNMVNSLSSRSFGNIECVLK